MDAHKNLRNLSIFKHVNLYWSEEEKEPAVDFFFFLTISELIVLLINLEWLNS